jgi:Tfp pilus assembly protein PilF/general stress protein CsbA
MSRYKVPAIYITLAAGTLAAFLPVMHCGFISLDDPLYVTDNVHVSAGITWQAVRWAFTNIYANFWHPLTMISLMLDYQIFGPDPLGFHLTNIALHLASTLLLFFVLRRMTGECWKSAFVAGLFAVHPLHVESVVWVAERKDVLSAFFWMLTLVVYVFYAERPRFGTYLAALLIFVLGLMAKPMLVTMPCVMLLLDYWPLRRGRMNKTAPESEGKEEKNLQAIGKRRKPQEQPPLKAPESVRHYTHVFEWAVLRRLFLEKVPFFAVIPAFCILTFIAEGNAVTNMPLAVRISNAIVSYVTYISKTFWPAKLAVYYPYHEAWPLWQVVGSAFILLAMTVAVILASRRFPYLAVGWLWFLGVLTPVIGVVQVGSFAMADRFTYLPLIGLFIMIAWGVPELLQSCDRSIRAGALFSASGLILACLGVLTWTQLGYWKNSISVYNHALEVTSENSFIYYMRGVDYARSGDLARAVSDFDKVIEINPTEYYAFCNRADAYSKLGDNAKAIADYTAAIRVDPKDPKAYVSRGMVYHKLNRTQLALADYDSAIKLRPEFVEAYTNRGNVYNELGYYEQAISDYGKAIEIDPEFSPAYLNRADLGFKIGRREQATADLVTAARLGNERAKGILKSLGISW